MWSKILKLFSPPTIPETDSTLFEADSAHHHIIIRDEGQHRTMYFGQASLEAETSINISNASQAVFEYPGLMLASLTLCPNGRKILLIGLGGGVIPTLFQKFLPNYQMTVVEIDPMVFELAQCYFGFQPGLNVEVVLDDGRDYIDNLPPQSFDQIWLDAFSGDYVPPRLIGENFLKICQNKLNTNGILVQNLHQSQQQIFQNQLKTTSEVFNNFLALDGERSGNAVVISQKYDTKPPNWTKSQLVSQAKIIAPIIGPYNIQLELDKIKDIPINPTAIVIK